MTGPIARAILSQTAADHGLPLAVMLQRSRSPDRVAARFDAMRRLRGITRPDGRPRFSLPQIGEMLGLHHTSVLNGLRRMEDVSAQPDIAPCLSSRLAPLVRDDNQGSAELGGQTGSREGARSA